MGIGSAHPQIGLISIYAPLSPLFLSFSVFFHMLSLGLFLNFENITYGKYIIQNLSSTHIYVGLNYDENNNNYELNPHAETFFTQMPTRACGPTSPPPIYEYSDTDGGSNTE